MDFSLSAEYSQYVRVANGVCDTSPEAQFTLFRAIFETATY